MNRITPIFALLLATTIPVAAQPLDAAMHDFLGAPGFQSEDVSALDESLADHWLDGTAMTPGGGVGPIEKALLIAAEAIPSIRTRTAISYGERIGEDGSPTSFITLRHYNLGPVIRAETADAYGEENTADIEEFGLGDHMEWRMVFQPVMGHAAMLFDASRRVIPQDEAEQDDCFGRLCLDPYAGFDEMAEWDETSNTLPAWPDIYPVQSDDVSTPANAVAELAVLGYWASAESGSYQWTGGEHPEAIRDATPYRFISIDRHLGQEASIDTVWRETALNDDSLFAVLYRRAEVAGEVYLMQAAEAR